MLVMKELLKGADFHTLPKETQDNLLILLEKINKVRELYGKPMTVTSGVRTMAHHIEIYKNLAIQRKIVFNINQVPMGSQHLKGAAVDIADPDGKLYDWCQANQDKLAEIGLWCEEADDQRRVHFQIVPPRSGKRFFKP